MYLLYCEIKGVFQGIKTNLSIDIILGMDKMAGKLNDRCVAFKTLCPLLAPYYILHNAVWTNGQYL